MEALAECAVDELTDIGMEAEHASELIMIARRPWFEDEEQEQEEQAECHTSTTGEPRPR